MESHNHPSYIEPYQGATTGVGGILARRFHHGRAADRLPQCALLPAIPIIQKPAIWCRAWSPALAVYGNSFGVPTVGGEVRFHRRYDGNCLVNAMAVGLAEPTRFFTRRRPVSACPSSISDRKPAATASHGATMASAEFGADAEQKRPTVQVGDPFSEKLLLEACLEIMAKGCVIAIQDMGAAGLTCSAVEMGAKGDLGVTLDLDKVPCREAGMSAYEMMLSESQERMLMVLKPEKEKRPRRSSANGASILRSSARPRRRSAFLVRHGGAVMADLPIKELGDEAPLYDRPFIESPKRAVIDPASVKPPMGVVEALESLIGSPDLCSRRWVFQQYDHVILGNTVQRPGGDAAVVRVNDGPRRWRSRRMSRRVIARPIRSKAASRRWRRHGAISPPSVRRRLRSPTTSISATRSAPRSWVSSSAASAALARRPARSISRRFRQRVAL